MCKTNSSAIKVSIIVPVYNVEKYLERCIISIIEQSYSGFELILVNDGSTDSSGKICDQYADIDTRIKVIHKPNEGVSIARNIGILHSIGEYILFVDSDDWIEHDLVKKYIELMEEYQSDLLVSEYISEDGNNSLPQINNHLNTVMNREQTYYKIVNPNGFYGSVWGKLFVSSIIKRNHLTFNPTIRIGEDLLFTMKYITLCRKVIYLDAPLYHYFIREGSALRNTSTVFDKKRLDIIRVYNEIINIEYFNNKQLKNRAIALYVRECADWYCCISYVNDKETRKYLKREAIRNLTIFMNNSVFSSKTKIVTLLKLILPKMIFKLKYRDSK